MHANIGPADTPVTRAILRADAELKQVSPNLTFIYDPQITPDDLLLNVAQNICECSKPHISNGPENDKIFTKRSVWRRQLLQLFAARRGWKHAGQA